MARRLFSIGDIHGCETALQRLLEIVPLSGDDQIVTLGDYVDRGPRSRQVIDWLIAQTERGGVIPLRGNHEVMMLEALRGEIPLPQWLQFGGDTTLNSYAPAGQAACLEDLPLSHLRFLEQRLLPYYETDTHIFVHACVSPKLPMNRQSNDVLFWHRFEEMTRPHQSGKIVICGHTAQKAGLPVSHGFAICLDTWVYGQGWLTCLEVATGQYWQANQAGETRAGWLP
jgi:serine/threonine protein phosphatase 1